jgi:hypothetical protein
VTSEKETASRSCLPRQTHYIAVPNHLPLLLLCIPPLQANYNPDSFVFNHPFPKANSHSQTIIMSDTGRKPLTDREYPSSPIRLTPPLLTSSTEAQEKLTPDSQKSYTEQAKEGVTNTADSIAGMVQPGMSLLRNKRPQSDSTQVTASRPARNSPMRPQARPPLPKTHSPLPRRTFKRPPPTSERVPRTMPLL